MRNISINCWSFFSEFITITYLNNFTMQRNILLSLYLSVLAVVMGGCAALTDSQRKTVVNYAKLTQTYTQYPSEVARTYVGLGYRITMMPVSINQSNDDSVYRYLVTAYNTFELGNQNVKKVDDAIGILRQYAKALEALSSADLPDNFGKSAELFGKSLDNVAAFYNETYKPDTKLPLGFGKLAGEVITPIGKKYINRRQAVKLREYMTKGDTLVQLLNNDSQKAFSDLTSRWNEQKELIAAQHAALLKRVHSDNNDKGANFFYSYQLNKDATTFIEESAAFEKLLASCAKAISGVFNAHRSVLNDIRVKRSAQEQIADIQQLYEDVRTLQAEYQKLVNPTSK